MRHSVASSSTVFARVDFNFSPVREGGNADNATIEKLEPTANFSRFYGKSVLLKGTCISPEVENGVGRHMKYDVVTCYNENARIYVYAGLAGRQYLVANGSIPKVIRGRVIDVNSMGTLIVKPELAKNKKDSIAQTADGAVD